MNLFKKIFAKKNKPVIIVSGLPRSGTSMMMKMLEAGGLKVMIDNIREADDDNPKGYYEFERVKQLGTDHEWLATAGGKVVKIISMLLDKLPDGYEYKVIFMRREISEVLASQKQMLIRRGEDTDKVSDAEITMMYQMHVNKIEKMLAKRNNIEVCYVPYSAVIADVKLWSAKINQFLNGVLDENKVNAVVDSSLYRQRSKK